MKFLINSRRWFGIAALAIMTCAGQVAATPLLPGTTVAPTNTVNPGALGAATTSTSVNFSTASYNGTLFQEVFLGTTFDGITGTSFLWTITSNASSLDEIIRVTMTNFAGWLVGVGSVGTDGGAFPIVADRNAAGGTVAFDYVQSAFGIAPGTTAERLFIQTNATSFTIGSTQLIDGNIATISTFAPAAQAAVPEPGSLLLLGSALVGMGLVRRRGKVRNT